MFMYNIKSVLTDKSGNDKRKCRFECIYDKCGNDYGNGYYLNIRCLSETGRLMRTDLYDVRYEKIVDFKAYAINLIRSIYSGERGSYKAIVKEVRHAQNA